MLGIVLLVRMNSYNRKADLKAGGMAQLIKYVFCKHEVFVFEPQNLHKNVECGSWGDKYGREAPSSGPTSLAQWWTPGH